MKNKTITNSEQSSLTNLNTQDEKNIKQYKKIISKLDVLDIKEEKLIRRLERFIKHHEINNSKQPSSSVLVNKFRAARTQNKFNNTTNSLEEIFNTKKSLTNQLANIYLALLSKDTFDSNSIRKTLTKYSDKSELTIKTYKELSTKFEEQKLDKLKDNLDQYKKDSVNYLNSTPETKKNPLLSTVQAVLYNSRVATSDNTVKKIEKLTTTIESRKSLKNIAAEANQKTNDQVTNHNAKREQPAVAFERNA